MNAKTKSLIAAAALAIVATSASAYEAYGEQVPGQSTLSRAEVTAELVRAQRSGEIAQTAEGYSAIDATQFASSHGDLSREQVRSELAQARDNNNYVTANETYGTVVPGLAWSRSTSAE